MNVSVLYMERWLRVCVNVYSCRSWGLIELWVYFPADRASDLKPVYISVASRFWANANFRNNRLFTAAER